MSRRRQRNRKPKSKPQASKVLSEHFTKRDFYCKVNPSTSFKLSLGLIGGLELLRSKVNKRIEIVKGYETPESAETKGKVSRNLHVTGVAADIMVNEMDPKELFKVAQEIPEFKGIGLNVTDNYVHVDTRKADEVLLWVEENDRVIELSEENFSNYFG